MLARPGQGAMAGEVLVTTKATGIAEIDIHLAGEVFGTVGRLILHKRNEVIRSAKSATRNLDELIANKDKVEKISDLRRTNNILLLYSGAFDIDAAYNRIADVFKSVKAVFCVGTVTGGILVYIHKKDTKAVPAGMSINDTIDTPQSPTIMKFKPSRGNGVLETRMKDIQDVMTNVRTNITIQPTSGGSTFSFEQIMEGLQRLTPRQIESIRGEALLTYWKKRTEFQATLLRIYPAVNRVREIKSSNNSVYFNAFDPPFPVVPMNKLVNLTTQQGTRLMEVSMGIESFNLADLFRKPLLLQYGIILLGSNTTTGYGKTQLALRLAIEYCKAYQSIKQTPKSEALVIFSNTLDVARDVVFQKGHIWVIDEVSPGDTSQLVHMSENAMKVLLSPTKPTSIRCRNADLAIPTGVPRILTANAESPDEWMGRQIKWTEPMQRKAVTYQITKPIVDPSWSSTAQTARSSEDDAVEIADVMAEQLALPTERPVTLRSCLVSTLRLAFNL